MCHYKQLISQSGKTVNNFLKIDNSLPVLCSKYKYVIAIIWFTLSRQKD